MVTDIRVVVKKNVGISDMAFGAAHIPISLENQVDQEVRSVPVSVGNAKKCAREWAEEWFSVLLRLPAGGFLFYFGEQVRHRCSHASAIFFATRIDGIRRPRSSNPT